MNGIQILLLVLILLALSRVLWRYQKKSIDARLFVWWTIFWLIGGIAVIFPESINRVADYLGVCRGADVILYFAVILIFFMIFKLFSRLVEIEKNIVKIVRTLSLDSKNNSLDKTQDHPDINLQDDKQID